MASIDKGDTPPRKPRGLAALSPERRKEIASLGGRAVPSERRSFSQDHELAAAAGYKGGVTKASKLSKKPQPF